MPEETILSFNNEPLYAGDKVIIIYGHHLRNSVIESIRLREGITDMNGNKVGAIKVKGIKKEIYSNAIVKIPK